MDKNIVFPSKSRWRLESKTFRDLTSYIVDVAYDYYSKTISLNVLDAVIKGKPVVHEWIVQILENPGEEVFTLRHHNENLHAIYRKILKGIKLIGHKCNHNYTCNHEDIQDHELLFTYETIEIPSEAQ